MSKRRNWTVYGKRESNGEILPLTGGNYLEALQEFSWRKRHTARGYSAFVVLPDITTGAPYIDGSFPSKHDRAGAEAAFKSHGANVPRSRYWERA